MWLSDGVFLHVCKALGSVLCSQTKQFMFEDEKIQIT